ncbi:2-keto-3-deoxygalactonate kinase [Herbaspirillum sp. BH-1]|uniref:2-dehydro-3-deoxygalactonokinase n=1 Tax=Herbaspirillum frisingense TaxID=92645 RepID=A0ABU1PIH2_9BURK|nr:MULTISPECIES: 2-dehydro-3-deoxygalactonokinase [Herbaspirillum]MDR6585272.1 2-dehydro-3-deoxygalactonokinase [Herbaspirillum frisingense]PLY59033.1 2-keto-3-deoxygalactonate kinase [Herbaspirillum sp. BH-1]
MTTHQDIQTDCALIALDWGTSSLRCYRFDRNGQVIERRAHPWGIMNLPAVEHGEDAHAPYRVALQAACGDWLEAAPQAPLIAAGMVGSKQGWREAAYLNVPLSPDLIGSKLTEVDTGLGRPLWIVPGLLQASTLPNVMRGEETQVIGALQTRHERELLIGLPGTHSKWVRVVDGRIEHFDTFMTGEVYGALCAHTILGRTMHKPDAADDAAFLRGARVALGPEGKSGVLSNIFSSRTLGLTGELAAEAQPDYLSGLLIGHELAALKTLYPVQAPAIVLIGDAGLCRRYQLALDLFGLGPVSQAEAATEVGLWVLARHAGLVA